LRCLGPLAAYFFVSLTHRGAEQMGFLFRIVLSPLARRARNLAWRVIQLR